MKFPAVNHWVVVLQVMVGVDFVRYVDANVRIGRKSAIVHGTQVSVVQTALAADHEYLHLLYRRLVGLGALLEAVVVNLEGFDGLGPLQVLGVHCV